MENEKNLNEKPAFQELPDESLDAVAGGGEPVYYERSNQVKYSYEVGEYVWGRPRDSRIHGELKVCKILRKEAMMTWKGYVASYSVEFLFLHHGVCKAKLYESEIVKSFGFSYRLC